MKMYCIFREDRYTPYIFSNFALGFVQEVLSLFIFLISHHHPCISVYSLRIESVEQSTEMEIGCLVNLFLLQFIYIVGMESGNKLISLESHSECSQVPPLDFKFSPQILFSQVHCSRLSQPFLMKGLKDTRSFPPYLNFSFLSHCCCRLLMWQWLLQCLTENSIQTSLII